MKIRTDPVIILGAPRSGTSATVGVLEACGMNLGRGVDSKLKENLYIRDVLVKGVLRENGVHPKLQKIDDVKKDFKTGLETEALQWSICSQFDCSEDESWGFKIIKGITFWNELYSAFPDAKWILCFRNRDRIAESCVRTSFMDYSNDKGYWRDYATAFHLRMIIVSSFLPSDNVFAFFPFEDHFKNLVDFCGLTWNQDKVDAWIKPGRFHL